MKLAKDVLVHKASATSIFFIDKTTLMFQF